MIDASHITCASYTHYAVHTISLVVRLIRPKALLWSLRSLMLWHGKMILRRNNGNWDALHTMLWQSWHIQLSCISYISYHIIVWSWPNQSCPVFDHLPHHCIHYNTIMIIIHYIHIPCGPHLSASSSSFIHSNILDFQLARFAILLV